MVNNFFKWKLHMPENITSALWQNFKNQTSYMAKLHTWERLNQEALY